MPTYAELSADMLKDAANFFKTLASQNEAVRDDMTKNAAVYIRVAELLSESPTGVSPNGHAFKDLASKLMRDTAIFYRTLASQNMPIKDQLERNAAIYEQIADALDENPLAIMD